MRTLPIDHCHSLLLLYNNHSSTTNIHYNHHPTQERGKDDMNRRRSFEEGYGSFADFAEDGVPGGGYMVDEIDMARKKSSPNAKHPPTPP